MTQRDVTTSHEDRDPRTGERLPTVAEQAFLMLAQDWRRKLEDRPARSAATEEDERTSLAALLLIGEAGYRLSPLAMSEIGDLLDAGEARLRDSERLLLVWRLFLRGDPWSEGGPYRRGLELIVLDLDHEDSSYRSWVYRVAWFVQSELDRRAAREKLLRNVADTLVDVDTAAALASALFDSERDFWSAADALEPPRPFADQYRERIRKFKSRGLEDLQKPLGILQGQCQGEANLWTRRALEALYPKKSPTTTGPR